MEAKRIQKLLFNEYSDFEDMVLLESPFAQTTKDGTGIRQVQIGLTPTKLILAGDFLEQEDPRLQLDPEISTLELLSMFPVECVNMTILRKRSRNTLKAHFCNQQVLYFELASPIKREMWWHLWCERVKFLTPNHSNSEESDSSLKSNRSSISTCYCGPWNKRDLYFKHKYKCFIKNSRQTTESSLPLRDTKKNSFVRKKVHGIHLVNRFGEGVNENCCTSLYLSDITGTPPQVGYVACELSIEEDLRDLYPLAEKCVMMWERKCKKNKEKHQRRYAIAPMGLHLFGHGVVQMSKQQCAVLQLKRSSSEVLLNHITSKSHEFNFGIQKRRLVSTMSHEHILNLGLDESHVIRSSEKYNYPQGFMPFWTPSLAHQSLSPLKDFNELTKILIKIQKRGGEGKFLLWKKSRKSDVENKKDSIRSGASLKRYSSSYILRFLKEQLSMDVSLSSWDFDSSTISYELTIIDRDLFLQILPSELAVLSYERNSSNAPGFNSMIKFSERISNLIATEIVRVDSIKMRARLISKYVNVADKLHRLHNMQSTRTVLLALQHPAIYSLKKTWHYMRQHHSSKYQRLFILFKVYKEPRSKFFSQLFEQFSRTMPYIPSVHFIVCCLIGKLPCLSGMCVSLSNQSLTDPRPIKSNTTMISESTPECSYRSFDSDELHSGHGSPRRKTNAKPIDLKLALQDWQQAAKCYDLVNNKLAKDFLLKTKYSEGFELLNMSMNREPKIPDLVK